MYSNSNDDYVTNDNAITTNLSEILLENYGKTIFENIKNRLQTEHGMSFEQASQFSEIPQIKEILQDEVSSGFEIIEEFCKLPSEVVLENDDNDISYNYNGIDVASDNAVDQKYTTHLTLEKILDVLSFTESRKILEMTQMSPASPYYLVKNIDATKSTIYRKIKELENLGLLTKTNHLKNKKTSKTRPFTEYSNTTKSITVIQKDSKTIIKIIFKKHVKIDFPNV